MYRLRRTLPLLELACASTERTVSLQTALSQGVKQRVLYSWVPSGLELAWRHRAACSTCMASVSVISTRATPLSGLKSAQVNSRFFRQRILFGSTAGSTSNGPEQPQGALADELPGADAWLSCKMGGQHMPMCMQVCPYGLYAEQLSGTAFTVPRR